MCVCVCVCVYVCVCVCSCSKKGETIDTKYIRKKIMAISYEISSEDGKNF